MNTAEKLSALQRLYTRYEEAGRDWPAACRPGCAACCTRNVTVTTLEGLLIIDHMTARGQQDLIEKIQAEASRKRFQPAVTTNRMALLCLQGKDLPDDENDPAWGRCPLLTDARCPIYPVRPFGCRCMVSRRDCRTTGAADMDPLLLSVNHLFLQFIEHLDRPGFSGNLTDVLLFLHSDAGRNHYQAGIRRQPDAAAALQPNTVIPGLLVPPEHAGPIAPLCEGLREIIAES